MIYVIWLIVVKLRMMMMTIDDINRRLDAWCDEVIRGIVNRRIRVYHNGSIVFTPLSEYSEIQSKLYE